MLTVDIRGIDPAGLVHRIGAGSVVEILARSGDLYTIRYGTVTGVARFFDLLPF